MVIIKVHKLLKIAQMMICFLFIYACWNVFELSDKTYSEVQLGDLGVSMSNIKITICLWSQRYRNYTLDGPEMSNKFYSEMQWFAFTQNNKTIPHKYSQLFYYGQLICSVNRLLLPISLNELVNIKYLKILPNMIIIQKDFTLPTMFSTRLYGEMSVYEFPVLQQWTFQTEEAVRVRHPPEQVCFIDNVVRIGGHKRSQYGKCELFCGRTLCNRHIFLSTSHVSVYKIKEQSGFKILRIGLVFITRRLISDIMYAVFLTSLFGTIFGFSLIDLATNVADEIGRFRLSWTPITVAWQIVGLLLAFAFTVQQILHLSSAFGMTVNLVKIGVLTQFPDVSIIPCLSFDSLHPLQVLDNTTIREMVTVVQTLYESDNCPVSHVFLKPQLICSTLRMKRCGLFAEKLKVVIHKEISYVSVDFKNTIHDSDSNRMQTFSRVLMIKHRDLRRNRNCTNYDRFGFDTREHCINDCVWKSSFESIVDRFPTYLRVDFMHPTMNRYLNMSLDHSSRLNSSLLSHCERNCALPNCFEHKFVIQNASFGELKILPRYNEYTFFPFFFEQRIEDAISLVQFLFAFVSILNFAVGFNFFTYSINLVRRLSFKGGQHWCTVLQLILIVMGCAHALFVFVQYDPSDVISDCRVELDFVIGPHSAFLCERISLHPFPSNLSDFFWQTFEHQKKKLLNMHFMNASYELQKFEPNSLHLHQIDYVASVYEVCTRFHNPNVFHKSRLRGRPLLNSGFGHQSLAGAPYKSVNFDRMAFLDANYIQFESRFNERSNCKDYPSDRYDTIVEEIHEQFYRLTGMVSIKLPLYGAWITKPVFPFALSSLHEKKAVQQLYKQIQGQVERRNFLPNCLDKRWINLQIETTESFWVGLKAPHFSFKCDLNPKTSMLENVIVIFGVFALWINFSVISFIALFFDHCQLLLIRLKRCTVLAFQQRVQ
jgi:hypothetical protein